MSVGHRVNAETPPFVHLLFNTETNADQFELEFDPEGLSCARRTSESLSCNKITSNANNYQLRMTRKMNGTFPIVNVLDNFGSLGGSGLSKRGLPLFSGDEEQDWQTFHRRFEDLIRMAPTALTDAQKAAHLIGHLSGRARNSVEKLSDDSKKVYADVVEAVKKVILSPDLRHIAKQRFFGCRQEPGESVNVFSERLGRLLRAVLGGKTDAEIEERFLDEFQDRLRPALAFHVKAYAPKTSEEALFKAKTYEALLAEAAGNASIFPTSLVTAMPAVMEPNVLASVPAAYSRRVERAWNNIICYRCNQPGHIQRYCQAEMPCDSFSSQHQDESYMNDVNYGNDGSDNFHGHPNYQWNSCNPEFLYGDQGESFGGYGDPQFNESGYFQPQMLQPCYNFPYAQQSQQAQQPPQYQVHMPWTQIVDVQHPSHGSDYMSSSFNPVVTNVSPSNNQQLSAALAAASFGIDKLRVRIAEIGKALK